MTTTSPGTDKTEQALPPLPQYLLDLIGWYGSSHANGESEVRRIARWHELIAAIKTYAAQDRAALTQRQQGGVGYVERALSDLLKAHAMHASCQAGLLDRCLCIRCATERARSTLTAAPPAQPREVCQPNGLMFDAFGEPRKRYVRVTLDGSHCVMDASEGDRYLEDARESHDSSLDRYVLADVWLSEREFEDLGEFDGF